ncbi:MAG: DinB family protein [Acidobacteria bacterium]|nr:DinB family protein [Acidobacteriota bacterium]
MKNIVKLALALGLTTAFVISSFAQSMQAKRSDISGARAETMSQLVAAEKKFIALAEAMPQEKYSWRPGEGVRSVSEVFMHVASSNYGVLSAAGVKPEGVTTEQLRGYEKITDKAKVIAAIKKSFEDARSGIEGISDDDLDNSVKLFGSDSTVRGVLIALAVHCHEHLGQSIAYARTNGVVPPWSVK